MLRWKTFDLVFFDCDSTLSTIEGVDELARLKGKEGRVGLLTQKAMDGDLDLSEVYGKRLRAINPTRGQLEQIEQLYWDTMVPDAQAVIETLQHINKHIFVISGGLFDAVCGFGKRLGISADHIRAVTLEYNVLSGQWWRYYDHSARKNQQYLDYDNGPLTITNGKAKIVEELAGNLFGQRLLVGDGSSDLATQGNGIDLFVGFGGVVVRDKVEQEAEIFIYPNTLAPILPLATGSVGWQLVQNTPYQDVFRRGLDLCFSNAVKFNNKNLLATFTHDFEKVGR
jgi:phosphoserine phosphatase